MPTELYFATPPTWTEDAICQHEWPHPMARAHKSMWDADHLNEEAAASLCEGCPIIEACLSAALEEEGTLIARHRYGIRGGKTPKARAALAAPAECSKGHPGEMVANTGASNAKWICLACRREESRRHYYNHTPEQRARKLEKQREWRSRRAVCPQCGGEYTLAYLSGHLKRRHAEPEGEVAS